MGKRIDASLKESEKRIMKALDDRKDNEMKEQLEKKMANMEENVVGKINAQQECMTTTLEKQSKVVEVVPKVTMELKHSTEELKKFMLDSQNKEVREKT